MNLNSETVKKLAYETGFDLCGITRVEPIESAKTHYENWIEKNYHGEMDYLAKNIDRRTDPEALLENSKSIIMLGLNYYHPNSSEVPKNSGRVARYARGKDYHKVTEKMLKAFIGKLSGDNNSREQFKYWVDYGPFMERAYATKAGLGFVGKNSMLINKKFGSWFLLSEIVTTLKLEPDNPTATNHGDCGECRLCVEACPTGAIISGRRVNSKKCISYLTIERPSEIHPKIAEQFGDNIFGCDICQEICPYNEEPIITSLSEFQYDKGVGEFVDAKEILSMESDEQFLKLTAGTPLTRPKLKNMKRNAEILLKNQKRNDI